MQLERNQYVVFPDGTKEGYLGARWSEKEQAFYKCVLEVDEEGYEEWHKIYSNEVITVERKTKKKPFIPSKENCTVELYVLRESAKAYAIYDGDNGLITRPVTYYKWIAKSVCYVEDGRVYAPVWAVK